MWIFLVLIYGIFKGIREVCKKKAMQFSSPLEILLVYSIISFLLVTPDFKNALGLEPHFYAAIAFKSFVIFIAWIFSFIAIKKLPISLYGVLDLSRVLFATFLGVTVLGETMSIFQIGGLILVCLGLVSLKFSPKTQGNCNTLQLTLQTQSPEQKNQRAAVYILMAFISCALNAISGLMDKILMQKINSSQLQCWYMMFLVLFYILYAIFTKQKVSIKNTLKNKWVWLLSILFVAADRALFLANADPQSRITVMTLIKQSGCIVVILAGKFVFKEKNILHKAICAAIIIAGIFLGAHV